MDRWSSSFAHLSRPANDCFLPGADTPVADPPVFGKRTFCSYWPHSYAGLIFFKQQHVARTYPECPAYGKGHGNSAFRRNLRLCLQCRLLPIPYSIMQVFYLTTEMCVGSTLCPAIFIETDTSCAVLSSEAESNGRGIPGEPLALHCLRPIWHIQHHIAHRDRRPMLFAPFSDSQFRFH